MISLLVFLHLLGVIVWVGGMSFAHLCLRPEAAAQLQPPQRLPLLAGVLGRFFRLVLLAILLILATGFIRLGQTGFAGAPLHWHLMAASGLLMVGIFAVIYHGFYPRLKAGVAAADWPAAGAAMNRIRQLVAINLLLGLATVAVAVLGGALGG